MPSQVSNSLQGDSIQVVIPYFQREPGILQRALRSVFCQAGVDAVSVVVVDDASPVSADSELAGLAKPWRFPVSVVKRRNGGPGAARNSGLDALPDGVRLVAFLDSDDEWTPDHLHSAVQALDCGFDAYFADLMQLNATTSGFMRAGRLRMEDHPRLESAGHLRQYTGDMFAQIIAGNIIGTSTVVYRFDRFRGVRFRPEFRTAGEDYLFWMDLVNAGARFAFSERIEAVYGRGVNVYAGVQWGSIELLWRIHYEMRYRMFTARNYTLDERLKDVVQQKRHTLRREFAKACLSRLARFKRVPLAVIREQARLDPATFGVLLGEAIGIRPRTSGAARSVGGDDRRA